MPLYNFPRIDSEQNTAGYTQFYFIPQAELLADPLVFQEKVVGNLSIAGSWYRGYSVFTSLILSDNSSDGKHGNLWNTELSGLVPVWKPETQDLLENLSKIHMVVIIKDLNNRLRLLGDKNFHMRLRYELQGSGYQYILSGSFPFPAPYYEGALPLY
jgi:hypothetical protein